MYLYKTYHKIIEELKVYNTCNGFTLLIFRNKVELHISLYIIKPMKYFYGIKPTCKCHIESQTGRQWLQTTYAQKTKKPHFLIINLFLL